MVPGSSPGGPTKNNMPYLLVLLFLSIALWISHAAIALLLGISLCYLVNLSDDFFTKKIGTKALQTGIVFLGGSISVPKVAEITGTYLPWISVFVVTIFLVTISVGKLLGVTKKQSYLLASGSAICGGTAIAVVAPIIKAKPEELITAISIVFILNAVAVILFPIIGSWINLSEEQFGAWVALAIHDTASVVGAASIVGEDAVEVAATLKLWRTVWIIPLVLFSAWFFKEKKSGSGFPLFVLFFAIAVILNSILSPSEEINNILKQVNKTFLLIGLFCIGTQIEKQIFNKISLKPFFLAVLIWMIVIPTSLWIV